MTDDPRANHPQAKFLIGHDLKSKSEEERRKTASMGGYAKAKADKVRAELARIAGHEFQMGEGAAPLPEQIKNKVFGGKLTGAQILAATRFAQALKNWKAMEGTINDIDGKLVEKKEIKADIGYAELVTSSMREGLEDATLVDGMEESRE